MTMPKQQHWVPRFYLRYFATPETAAGDEPQVWILSKDEGEPKLTLSPTRVLMMDDRHDQPAGRYYPLADTGPGIANGLAWRNCERFMISPRHPDDVCAEILASAG